MHKLHIAVLAVLLGCLSASAVPVDNCGFEKVPRDALLALHEARGKPFTGGAVFVNGKYLPPPYVVSRYGTAIVINGHQVTGQIVSWNKFLGSRPAASAPAAPAESKPANPAPANPAGKVEEASSLDELFDDDSAPAGGSSPAASAAPAAAVSDGMDSIDDLFGDEAPKPKAKPRAAVAKPARPAAPAGPPPKYVPSARTKQLLDVIDKQRTAYDRALRMNNFYFFSPRYSNVGGNLRVLGIMSEKLPDALKDASSADDLYARLRRSGLGFVSPEVCTDLFANKRTFLSLYELRSRVREEIEHRKSLTSESSY